MHDYKTVEEKAAEWNITPRHIQYLCRTGKIQGVIKRAGSWFIPDAVPNPAQNTKADAERFKFLGTKGRVFDSAIQLFMSRGYNDVSLRDIAKNAGIQQSTIYNHFSTKQEILDTIYDFYCHHYQKNRPSLNDMEHAIQNESIMDIIQRIRYDFEEDYKQKMSDITKIIFQRIAIDDRAREISKTLIMESGIKYVEDVFDKAIEIGRFAPFDTHAMAVFINSVRIFTLYCWIVDPSLGNIRQFSMDEHALFSYAIRLIKEIKQLDESQAEKKQTV